MLKFLPKCSFVTGFILCTSTQLIGIGKQTKLNEDRKGVQGSVSHPTARGHHSWLQGFSPLHDQCPFLGAKPCVNCLRIIDTQPDHNGSCTPNTTLNPRSVCYFSLFFCKDFSVCLHFGDRDGNRSEEEWLGFFEDFQHQVYCSLWQFSLLPHPHSLLCPQHYPSPLHLSWLVPHYCMPLVSFCWHFYTNEVTQFT